MYIYIYIERERDILHVCMVSKYRNSARTSARGSPEAWGAGRVLGSLFTPSPPTKICPIKSP